MRISEVIRGVAAGFAGPGRAAVEDLAAYAEAREARAEEEARRVRQLADEARDIVAGRSMLLPTAEHLAALLLLLDGHVPERQPQGFEWDGTGTPF